MPMGANLKRCTPSAVNPQQMRRDAVDRAVSIGLGRQFFGLTQQFEGGVPVVIEKRLKLFVSKYEGCYTTV